MLVVLKNTAPEGGIGTGSGGGGPATQNETQPLPCYLCQCGPEKKRKMLDTAPSITGQPNKNTRHAMRVTADVRRAKYTTCWLTSLETVLGHSGRAGSCSLPPRTN